MGLERAIARQGTGRVSRCQACLSHTPTSLLQWSDIFATGVLVSERARTIIRGVALHSHTHTWLRYPSAGCCEQ